MKKTYERPIVYVERFDLAQSIAAGCSVLETFGGTSVNNTSQHTCGIIMGAAPSSRTMSPAAPPVSGMNSATTLLPRAMFCSHPDTK